MAVQLELGDKVWMHYGPSVLVVGHLVDFSPDYKILGISPVPYEEYKDMDMSQRAGCPISWCETRACHYLSHVLEADLKHQDEKVKPNFIGFGGKRP